MADINELLDQTFGNTTITYRELQGTTAQRMWNIVNNLDTLIHKTRSRGTGVDRRTQRGALHRLRDEQLKLTDAIAKADLKSVELLGRMISEDPLEYARYTTLAEYLTHGR